MQSLLYLLLALYVIAIKVATAAMPAMKYPIWILGYLLVLAVIGLYKSDQFGFYAKNTALLMGFFILAELIFAQNPIAGYIFVATVLLGVGFNLAYVRPKSLIGVKPARGSINKETKVGSIEDARENFLVKPGGTFSCYFHLGISNRTAIAGSDGDGSITLFKMGDVMQFKLVPQSATSASSTVKAELVIRTQKPTDSNNKEIISVESLPMQKWVQITIVREGRRFTVYYNGKIVASERTLYYPVIDTVGMTVGANTLVGLYALPRFADVPLRLDEVHYDLSQTSDTRYKPIEPSNFLDTLREMFSGCPKGIFCFSTSTPPTYDPLKVWKSPYA